MRSVLGVHWKDWCWSWNSNTLAILCEELTHWKRSWCWEGLGAGGEGDDRGWDGWMASPTRWTWVWVNSRSWWWTGRPGVLQFMGSQKVGHDGVTELNWTEISSNINSYNLSQNISERYGLNIFNCLSSDSISLPYEVFDIAIIIIALDMLLCGCLIVVTIVIIIIIMLL